MFGGRRESFAPIADDAGVAVDEVIASGNR